MDSVPQAAERRHLGVLTLLAAAVLLAFVLLMTWFHVTGSPVEDMEEPERALAVVVGRSLDLDDGIEGAPAWERHLYRSLLGSRDDDLAEALRWYAELEAASLEPSVDLHLAILEGEAGRRGEVRRRLDEWQRRGEPFETFARVIGRAYLASAPDGADAHDLVAAVDAVLEPGWFHDRLVARLTRSAAPNPRAGGLLARLRAFTAVEVAVLAAGLVTLASWRGRRGDRVRSGTAPLPPPWRGRDGLDVLVRGGALGAVLLIALDLGAASFLGDRARPYLGVVVSAATNLAFLPVILVARRRLLVPSGLDVARGFGLALTRANTGRLLRVALVLLAAGQLGDWTLGATSRAFGITSHWSEWFDRDLVWGAWPVVLVTLVDTVVVTPVFEELVFRGLLFGTLRRRLAPAPAAAISAGLFALAHGYGVLGFAAVFWSGLLWAWAYDRTGSLVPPIIAHAVDNLSAAVAVLLVLRV
jgi:membrane protease YdiL (CAAX protease family)